MNGLLCQTHNLSLRTLAGPVLLPVALLAATLACTPRANRSVEPVGLSPPAPRPGTTLPSGDAYAERLHEILARSDALTQYRLTFYRRERLGDKLHAQEQIRALFRKEPFSVKFTWENPDPDYYESVYVAGQNDNKLVVRERKPALPILLPTVRKLDPAAAVKFGRALYPVTEFGLANMVRHTLTGIEDPAARSQITIRLLGLVNLEPQNTPAYQLHIERPAGPDAPYTAQDFYIDTRTHLPTGTDLFLPDGQLAASYRYADLDPNVNLTNADFRLSGP